MSNMEFVVAPHRLYQLAKNLRRDPLLKHSVWLAPDHILQDLPLYVLNNEIQLLGRVNSIVEPHYIGMTEAKLPVVLALRW